MFLLANFISTFKQIFTKSNKLKWFKYFAIEFIYFTFIGKTIFFYF